MHEFIIPETLDKFQKISKNILQARQGEKKKILHSLVCKIFLHKNCTHPPPMLVCIYVTTVHGVYYINK
jgi:hypothetical protein